MATPKPGSGGRRQGALRASASKGETLPASDEDLAIVTMSMAIAQAHAHANERHTLIERAAYFRAEKRGFQPGYELDDWLAAEKEVALDQLLSVISPGGG